ncbi:MAG: hypothetical protein IJK46_13045 [Prevotella sp.]|nr:hypothetical protein [Prevotella sp.]
MISKVMSKNILFCLLLGGCALLCNAADYKPKDYVWTTQSRNSSESMPCGGCDIGMNVWVENGDVLFYVQQSGWFDENNTSLKAGRWRIHTDGQQTEKGFEQRLCLDDGAIYITLGDTHIRLWADVMEPVVFCEVSSKKKMKTTLSYESWRYKDRNITKAECQQTSYKWTLPDRTVTFADSIEVIKDGIHFFHQNSQETVFDYTVKREFLEEVKDQIYNPIGGLRMEGTMNISGLSYKGTHEGDYAGTDFRAWDFCGTTNKANIAIAFGKPTCTAQTSQNRSARWWHQYWQRSWIQTDNKEAAEIVRNYELFRYMLGCNAFGQWPTKFNGGLFTFDPLFVASSTEETYTPDYRKWGGGTMTAQNQRLVYWPMLKSGDAESLRPQLDTYLRILPTAKLWAKHFWGHGGACFYEQIENSGLPNPAEYGKPKTGQDFGVGRNAWLEYEWDTALEFCMMALQAREYAPDTDWDKYEPLIEECLRFFDEHYQYEANKRGAKTFDANGKLVIYPGSGCETYKMAYNPSCTIAALKAVLEKWGKDTAMLHRIPDIPTRVIEGDTCIAPAVVWERIQNVETPQLYPVFPWRIFGLGRPSLLTAVNTYEKDPHALEMRSSKGWKQDNIWAACLGLTDEARRLNLEKLGNGPYRFPAFWDPGFDWAPDHNRGGAGMIGLQEMLLQETPEGELLLFPAWPKEWNAKFRLHATGGRIVEAEIINGKISLKK